MTEKSAVRILVLDDEPLTLKLLRHMLESLSFAPVTTCENGRAALGYVDSPDKQPNLILLDLNMPELDGIEFVRMLAERRYAGSLILISGEDDRILQAAVKLVKAHKIPVLGHLHKPVTREGLVALLLKWNPLPQNKLPGAQKVYSADELRAAIANGELINYYQPKVAVATGRVVGVETLVGWKHPADGLLLPDQFIGVADAHGLNDDLTRAVLTGALAQTRRWQEMGLTLQVAVNTSMDNLVSLDFVDFVAAQAAASGVSPQQVTLEVAESRLMQDLRAPLEILTRLRMKHFRLSLDDFGTGHSSLVQLRDIPFNELKVDRSFVHGIRNNGTARAMFCASLGMAKQMNMETVAEGIEDQADWDFLRTTECNTAQGYFIAKPMPATDLPGWIQNWPSSGPE